MSPFQLAFIRKLASESFLAGIGRRGATVAGYDPFWYNASFSGLTTAAAQAAIIQTQADSDFVLTSISAQARLDLTGAGPGCENDIETCRRCDIARVEAGLNVDSVPG